MALTGRTDGPPLGPPRPLVSRLHHVAELIATDTRALGCPVDLDPLALLGERAARYDLGRAGDRTCGGNGRLLRARDGWFAVSLSRADDAELVPAWLGLAGPPAEVWATVAAVGSTMDTGPLVDRARLVGLAAAELRLSASPGTGAALPVRAELLGPAAPTRRLSNVVVVDLSSLWAGPLCGSILQLAGARVIKVESTSRPDGMRAGEPVFFDLLNGGKESVALDLRDRAGIAALHRIVVGANVVIEASRPRALEQLGLVATELLARPGGPRVWLSLTGYGRAAPGRDWIAFGDDAAVAGGLVVWDEAGPCFCADAIADPATGLVAAAAALGALRRGGRWLLDVAMAGVAAHLAGPTLPATTAPVPSRPRARTPSAPAAPFGRDTHSVLAPA